MKKLYTFRLALFLVLAALAQQAFSQNSSVLITEITGFEGDNSPGAYIVEITNRGSTPVDISDWKLELYDGVRTTPNSGRTITVPTSTILDGGESFMFYYDHNNNPNPLIPTGGSADCGYVTRSARGSTGRDYYEILDNNGILVDKYGVIGENPGAGINWNYRNSIVTRNGGIDQAYGNDNFDLDDWYILRGAMVEEITPCQDSPNAEPQPEPSTVMITEITHPSDQKTSKFVEICNRGTSQVDISGWIMQLYNNGEVHPSSKARVPENTSLDPEECFIFYYATAANPTPNPTYLEHVNGEYDCEYIASTYTGWDGNDVFELIDGERRRRDIYGEIGAAQSSSDHSMAWDHQEGLLSRRVGITETSPDNFDPDNFLDEWHIHAKGSSKVIDVTPCVDAPVGPLPVTWVSFNAVQGMNGVDLLWQTSEEFNNAYFEVQRSVDGIEWTALDRVEPLTEDGSTSRATFNNYKYRDITPLAGMNYYRIKQVDIDAEYDYSEVRSVHVQGEKTDILLSPNPASTILNIYAADEIVRMDVYDMRGQRVMESVGNVKRLDIAHFTPGIYYLRIMTETGHVAKKFVKQ